mgnify:CR=1 FL=1
MITQPEKNRRGRPTGWRKPDRREREDFRFTPETRRILEDHGGDDKTHYAANKQAAQAVAYQIRIDGLLDQLEQARQQNRAYEAEIRYLHAKLATARQAKRAPASTPAPEPVKRLDPTKTYQLIITHEPGQPCPDLPADFAYEVNDKTVGLKGAFDAHTTHAVLTKQWPVAKMRKELEKLKSVPGITGIWIARMGLALRATTGRPTDMWHRNEQGTWVKDN